MADFRNYMERRMASRSTEEAREAARSATVAVAMTSAQEMEDDYAYADEASSRTTSGDDEEAGPPRPLSATS